VPHFHIETFPLSLYIPRTLLIHSTYFHKPAVTEIFTKPPSLAPSIDLATKTFTKPIAMYSSKQNKRQTTIIEDLGAIGLAEQSRQGAPKKNAAGRSGPSAARKASSPKPKATKKPTASQDIGLRFYEGNGVKIPLYDEGGRKRAHARLSKSLRNKNTDYLLEITEQYAGKDKRKEFENSNKTKAEIADWIEEKETIALGPNPRSALECESESSTWALREEDFNTEDEDALWAGPEQADGEGLLPPPMQDNSTLNTVEDGYNEVAMMCDLTNLMNVSLMEMIGKRRRDCTPEPAQERQQTPKKPKVGRTERQLAEQSIADLAQAQVRDRDGHPKTRVDATRIDQQKFDDLPSVLNEISEASATKAEKELEEALRVDRLHGFMGDIGMHPDNPDASTFVVQLPEETRVLTVGTCANTGRPILHDTSIPRAHDRTMAHQAHPIQQPYIKVGVHGRHGDFNDDPDRQTGRGHELSLEDLTDLGKYMWFRGQILHRYPRFPQSEAGQEIQPELTEGWNGNERWYIAFKNRYPGLSVGHLWPCGCEKLRGEGEDSDSEEE
jgi:hypothetical protein